MYIGIDCSDDGGCVSGILVLIALLMVVVFQVYWY